MLPFQLLQWSITKLSQHLTFGRSLRRVANPPIFSSSSAADASGCRGAPHRVESSSREGFHPAAFEEWSSRPFEGPKCRGTCE